MSSLFVLRWNFTRRRLQLRNYVSPPKHVPSVSNEPRMMKVLRYHFSVEAELSQLLVCRYFFCSKSPINLVTFHNKKRSLRILKITWTTSAFSAPPSHPRIYLAWDGRASFSFITPPDVGVVLRQKDEWSELIRKAKECREGEGRKINESSSAEANEMQIRRREIILETFIFTWEASGGGSERKFCRRVARNLMAWKAQFLKSSNKFHLRKWLSVRK